MRASVFKLRIQNQLFQSSLHNLIIFDNASIKGCQPSLSEIHVKNSLKVILNGNPSYRPLFLDSVNFIRELIVEDQVGDLTLNFIKGESLKVTSHQGSINLLNVFFSFLSLSSLGDIGQVRLRPYDFHEFDSISIFCQSGDVWISNLAILGNLNILSKGGNVTLDESVKIVCRKLQIIIAVPKEVKPLRTIQVLGPIQVHKVTLTSNGDIVLGKLGKDGFEFIKTQYSKDYRSPLPSPNSAHVINSLSMESLGGRVSYFGQLPLPVNGINLFGNMNRHINFSPRVTRSLRLINRLESARRP